MKDNEQKEHFAGGCGRLRPHLRRPAAKPPGPGGIPGGRGGGPFCAEMSAIRPDPGLSLIHISLKEFLNLLVHEKQKYTGKDSFDNL